MSSRRLLRGRAVLGAVTGLAVALGAASLAAPSAQAVDGRPLWAATGTVFTMDTAGGRVYIGGKFLKLRNTSQGGSRDVSRLAAFSQSTGELLDWAPRADGDVRALEVAPDGTVYIGGNFTTVNGERRSRIAAISSTGQLVAGFAPEIDKTVRSLTIQAGSLFAAGQFGRVDGQPRRGLVKLSLATGEVDRGWVANTTGGRAWATAGSRSTGRIIVGGSFSTVNGQPRSFLGSVSAATGAVSRWAPTATCATCAVLDLDTDSDGNVYAGVAGARGGRAASWALSSNDMRWRARGDGNVQAIAWDAGVVYAGGHFGPTFDGRARNQLAALNASNGDLLPFRVNLGTNYYPGVWDISVDSDYLRIAGGFASVDGTGAARYAELVPVGATG